MLGLTRTELLIVGIVLLGAVINVAILATHVPGAHP